MDGTAVKCEIFSFRFGRLGLSVIPRFDSVSTPINTIMNLRNRYRFLLLSIDKKFQRCL